MANEAQAEREPSSEAASQTVAQGGATAAVDGHERDDRSPSPAP